VHGEDAIVHTSLALNVPACIFLWSQGAIWLPRVVVIVCCVFGVGLYFVVSGGCSMMFNFHLSRTRFVRV